MIHSRLLVARYLLTRDGVIFVSIDDNEAYNLRRVMSDVFGDENFIAEIVWQKMDSPSRNAEDRIFSNYHEYIIAFARDAEHLGVTPENRVSILDAYPLTLPDGRKARRRQLRKNGKNARREDRPTMWFPLETPDGTELWPVAPEGWEGRWVLSKDEWESRTKQGLTEWIKRDYGWMAYYIEIAPATPTAPWSTLWTDVDQNRQAKAEFTGLMGSGVEFQTPKPSSLIAKMVKMCTEDGDIVLDFFGGSGTTAHGVIRANNDEHVNRDFILVQLPQLIEEKSANYRAGFKRISDITIERVKRVIQKLKRDGESLLPNDPQRQFAEDLGFKVFTLAKSAFPRVDFAPDPTRSEADNIASLKQYIREKEATFLLQFERDKVLDEVLLKHGFMLDYTVTRQPQFKGNEVLLAKDAHKESLVCFDAKLELETVDYFKNHKDRFFICLDLALDTTKKWNLKHNLGEKLKAF
jgi:adenine-specific DNA-methyltransferase